VAARNAADALLEPMTVSVAVALLAMPASILGNEAAIRFGRPRAIACVMGFSAAVAVLLGLLADGPPLLLLGLLLLYAFSVPADSGALTSGMAAAASADYRGATMALHSSVGFGLSAVGAWAVGVALDAGGGVTSGSGWRAGFLMMAAGALLGPFALWWSNGAARGPRRKRCGAS
jgi:MFS family permease